MAEWTREINTNYNFPDIDIINILKDGVQKRFEAIPHDGYLMYDSNANNTEPKENETGDIVYVPVTYYFTSAGFPLNYNFNKFSWVAVPENERTDINEFE